MKAEEQITQKNVVIPVGNIKLEGIFGIPKNASGLVIFVHGSGSSRHSSRNNYVARILQKAKFATLLFDLLTEEEDKVYSNRFDIPLLARRLEEVTTWALLQPETKDFKVGYFGASTGAAAAIETAARLKQNVHAIVSRGGRPDLAGTALKQVIAPTLLIVGGADSEVLELNKKAEEDIIGETKLEVVPDATHLFEEPGALDAVAELAVEWFDEHLR